MTDYLTGADQNIPECPVNTIFLGEFGTAVRLGIKP